MFERARLQFKRHFLTSSYQSLRPMSLKRVIKKSKMSERRRGPEKCQKSIPYYLNGPLHPILIPFLS